MGNNARMLKGESLCCLKFLGRSTQHTYCSQGDVVREEAHVIGKAGTMSGMGEAHM